jgi:hypothetical protein
MAGDQGRPEGTRIGLCQACRHLKRYRNDRGSIFYYCRRSESDPTYPKYPVLPVSDCAGFERDMGSGPPAGGTTLEDPPMGDSG